MTSQSQSIRGLVVKLDSTKPDNSTLARVNLTLALDAVFAVTDRLDIAYSGQTWLRPDAAGGRWAHLGGLDRAGFKKLEAESWARNLRGGWGVHWRGTAPAPFIMIDDLDDADAAAIAARYKALVISTSEGSHQVIILCSRPLTGPEQHAIQAELVRRLNAGSRRRADPGATGAGQFARLPGFGHGGHGGRIVRVVWRPWSGTGLLDVDAVLAALPDDPVTAVALTSSCMMTIDTDTLARPAQAQPQPGEASPCALLRPRVPCAATAARGRGRKSGQTARRGESELEFAFACREIRAGRDSESIISELADRAFARGKRDTQKSAIEYAQRTYSKALAVVRD